jgi:FAD-linked oxidoreductase
VKRRDFLASSLGLLAAGALGGCDDPGATNMPTPPAPAVGPDGSRRIPWQNWSGYQHAVPAARVAPESLDQLVDLMRTGPAPIRPVGAGHSFTPLVPTDGTLLSLGSFEGLLTHDAPALTATLGAGTRLGDIGPLLDELGQALPNMPDIDQQSLAGAIGTATHGTGPTLGALHAYVTGLQLVTARGEVLDCSRERNAAIFDAARVSLGSLGAITQVTLANAPTHNLRRRVWIEPLDELLERFDELAARHYSFEFYYFPFCDFGAAIAIDPTDAPVSPRGEEQDLDVLRLLKAARDYAAWWPWLRRWLLDLMARNATPEEAVDTWYRVYPSARTVRWNEMEYHLPREQLLPTLRKVRETLEARHPEVFFPVEVRLVKGDDAWLSPFGAHDVSGSIAVHHFHVEDPLPYFASIEPLFLAAGGRPHWGKMHTLKAPQLAALYPRWREFNEVRRTLDPEGRMLNAHLREVFGA